MGYEKELALVTELALEAGALLRNEFHRPGGPRGQKAHADADDEAEWLIRKQLTAQFPHYRYRGEETGSIETPDDHVWLVDPNDGTSSFLRGARGSAVSIGLVRKGIPVLGVVYAYTAPDDHGDLICWAEDQELTRNGKPVKPVWNLSPSSHVVLLVSTHGEHLMETLLKTIQPYRYRTFPSVAYRLALAAVGDGDAAVSWHGPGDWDYAAGHALLRAAGGIFVNETGREITYAPDGFSKVRICFGGHQDLVNDLCKRDWRSVQKRHSMKMPQFDTPFLFSRLQPGKSIPDPDLLSRVQGCLIGQIAAYAMRNAHMAGQPSVDSEFALILARSIVKEKQYDPEKVAAAYRAFDLQESNALMRISPLGIYGYRKPPDELFTLAQTECSLTDPDPVTQQSCGLFCLAIAHAITSGEKGKPLFERIVTYAREKHLESSVVDRVQNVFDPLLHTNTFEDGASDGATGALLGAVYGREAIPASWRRLVLSCRSNRPWALWPVDLLNLSELLLL